MRRMRKGTTRYRHAVPIPVLILMLAAALLVGCDPGQATSETVDEGAGETYTSEVLDTSYPDALSVSNQLALGTLMLEETEQAVTPEQATTLLPLWQALRGGVTAQAEVDAVLKQIEGTMTQEQLEAIAALQLTQEDLRTWMQEQGMEGGFPGAGGGPGGGPGAPSDDARATRRAESGGGEMPPEMATRWAESGGEMPPEMATRRAGFANMTEDEREEVRATMEAGGGIPGQPGGRGGGRRQFPILLGPLIEMLETRAGER